MTDIRLRRLGDGNYGTRDGRFTITRTTMGEGVNNNGGWSPGHTAWDIEDTSGATPFPTSFGSRRASRIVDSLWEARDAIAYVYKQEAGR